MLRFLLLALYLAAQYTSQHAKIGGGWDPDGLTSQPGKIGPGWDPDGLHSQQPGGGGLDPNGQNSPEPPATVDLTGNLDPNG